MSHILSWFSTKSGRRFTHSCVGAAVLTVFGSQIAFHGPLLHKVKEICQVYDHGKPQQLPLGVNGIVEEVLQDSNLKEEQKEKLKFFYVVGPDIFHAGGINSPWGSIVGIPFTFQDIKDIELSELRIHGKETIDWIIDGQDLIKSLDISVNAKKFALMREIYSCNFYHVLSNAFIGAGCVFLPARMAQRMNDKLNYFEKLTVGKRCFRYFLMYCFGYLLYRLLKDPTKHLSDQKSDKLAAETGIDYLDGGIEYYQKTLMKNKALGELTNTSYRKMYDEKGNEHYFLFAPKLPVTKRLENLQNMKKEKSANVEDKS